MPPLTFEVNPDTATVWVKTDHVTVGDAYPSVGVTLDESDLSLLQAKLQEATA